MPIIKNSLEKILGEERFEKLRNTRAYNWTAEAFTLNTFSYPVAFVNELYIAGMDYSEHLVTRGAGLITNTVLGRPYGIWRDWLFKKTDTYDDKRSFFLRRWGVDTLAFAIGQLPIYWTNMALAFYFLNGELVWDDVSKMIIASIPVTLAAGPLGIPYSRYRKCIKKSCGLPIKSDKNIAKNTTA